MSHHDDIYLHDTAREDDTQERIDARVQELLMDRDAVLLAGEDIAGTLEYDGIENALADLASVNPLAIVGSDALARVLRLGDQCKAARLATLTEMAEADVAEAAAFRPDMEGVA